MDTLPTPRIAAAPAALHFGAGRPAPLGWCRAPNTSPLTPPHSGANKACPAKPAALFGFFNIPAATATSGAWSARFTGIASEWSPQFPGYVSGAIEVAGLGVDGWLRLALR